MVLRRRTLLEDPLDSVCFFPDQITVQVVGAPPIIVSLREVGLRAGTRTVVSEGGRTQNSTGGSSPGPVHNRRSGIPDDFLVLECCVGIETAIRKRRQSR